MQVNEVEAEEEVDQEKEKHKALPLTNVNKDLSKNPKVVKVV